MAADQLSKACDDGTVLGQSATVLIGFFGKTARVQVTAITSISAVVCAAEMEVIAVTCTRAVLPKKPIRSVADWPRTVPSSQALESWSAAMGESSFQKRKWGEPRSPPR